jgi:hypothetical protein
LLKVTAHFVVDEIWDNALMEQMGSPRSFEA